MSTAATPDPDLVAAALNRYARARVRARRGAPGSGEDVVVARAALVLLLEQAGWEPPASLTRAVHQHTGEHTGEHTHERRRTA